MAKFKYNEISDLLAEASISMRLNNSNLVTLKISGEIEANTCFDGIPNEIKGAGYFTVVRTGFRLTNTTLGRFCSIGPNVQFGSPEHRLDWLSASSTFYNDYAWTRNKRSFKLDKNALNYKSTTVGNDVWIGRGAFIKAGISIGDGAVIGAESVVTKNVDPYEIVAGNPAKRIRYRFSSEIIERLLESQWWSLDPIWISHVDFKDIEACLNFLEKYSPDFSHYNPTVLKLDEASATLMSGQKVIRTISAESLQ